MSTCATLQTGQGFVSGLLGAIDCNAQTFGAFGFAALSDPASGAFIALSSLLTVFIAIFGIRLLLGHELAGRDLVSAVLRIGIVLTLATSWPAWRILGYDLVTRAPGELAVSVIGAAGTPGAGDFVQRLQRVDDAVVVMTAAGSGRLTGGIAGGIDLGDSARGIALPDQSGFAWGRLFFLVGTLAPLGLLRILGGILVGIAPLMAGLLLFAGTRSVFMGWLRGLGLAALGALVVTLIISAELAVMEPWLADVLAQRQANVFTPSAPTELVALTLVFGLIAFAAVGVIARIAFFAGNHEPVVIARSAYSAHGPSQSDRERITTVTSRSGGLSRAEQLSLSVSEVVRREQQLSRSAAAVGTARAAGSDLSQSRRPRTETAEGRRRNLPRSTAAGAARDART